MPKPLDPQLRRRALELTLQHVPAPAVAKALNIPASTVYAWRRQARQKSINMLSDLVEEARTVSPDLARKLTNAVRFLSC